MPAICAQDHRIAEAMHGILIRTHTAAAGDGYRWLEQPAAKRNGT